MYEDVEVVEALGADAEDNGVTDLFASMNRDVAEADGTFHSLNRGLCNGHTLTDVVKLIKKTAEVQFFLCGLCLLRQTLAQMRITGSPDTFLDTLGYKC